MDVTARIRIIQADITGLHVEAIVNAANSALMPGGGVDGAIRGKAGQEINEELYRIGRCAPGEAVITRGYRLPAQYVIHTVAPIYDSRITAAQNPLLASCYDSVLALADRYQIRTVAFPAIGTGAYGWPSDVAAQIANARVTAHLSQCAVQELVTFCCFTEAGLRAYQSLAHRDGR